MAMTSPARSPKGHATHASAPHPQQRSSQTGDTRERAGAGTPSQGTSSRYAPTPDLRIYAWLCVGTSVVNLALKGTASWLTGSAALFSDAADALTDLFAAVFNLFILKIANKPADEDHQYGHSKAEYFSSVIEGVLILVTAGAILVNSIGRLINPQPLERLGTGVIISLIASLINGAVGWVLLRQGRAHRSETLIAEAKNLLTDVVTSLAIVVGVGAVSLTSWQLLDPLVGIAAGLNIIWTGIQLLRSSIQGFMDAALPEETQRELIAVLKERGKSDPIKFHAVRTRRAGNRDYMELHLLVPDKWTVRRGHDLSEQIIDDLIAVDPDLRVSVHLEPLHDPKSYADQWDV